MKIGVYRPSRMSLSVQRYADNVCSELEVLGAEPIGFGNGHRPPEAADIVWDPRAAGGVPPPRRFSSFDVPLVITVHGAAPFSVPWQEYYPNAFIALAGRIHSRKILHGWRLFRGRCAAIITVSDFAKREIRTHLRLEDENIVPIHHGVEHRVFFPGRGRTSGRRPYFLHVSSYQPVKNVDRILAAAATLDLADRPKLVAVVPGLRARRVPAEVELTRECVSHESLASLYRGAMAFIFPSIRESFGMPIIEAMASGCPVLTSRHSGCKEVAGDAAILVDPRSVDEIANAMTRLASDAGLRSDLRNRGLERARAFTWRKCAERHLAVFEDALRNPGRRL